MHSYSYYQVNDKVFDGKLDNYQSYLPKAHIRLCGCGDLALEAHSFDPSGKCVCGYQKEMPSKVKMEVFYGLWSEETFTLKAMELPREVGINQEVSVSAPYA